MYSLAFILVVLVVVAAGVFGLLAARKGIQKYNESVDKDEEHLLGPDERDQEWVGDNEQMSGSPAARGGTRLLLLVLGFSLLPAAVSAQQTDTERLLDLHEAVLQAHRDGDVAAWLAVEADTVLSVNNGAMTRLTRADRRSARSEYLLRATFDRYEDIRPPVVRVSADGTLGWVAVEVEVRGWMARDDGAIEDFAEAYAWVELYEKRDGQWVMTGNVSNSRSLE